MSISRRNAIQAFASALGIAGAAEAAPKPATVPGATVVPTTTAPAGSGPRPFYTVDSWPVLPCRIPDLTPEEKAEYERVFLFSVREDACSAALGLAAARAWWRTFPAFVIAPDPPELLEWRMRLDDSSLDDVIQDFGPADPGFTEECRAFAEKYIRREREKAAARS